MTTQYHRLATVPSPPEVLDPFSRSISSAPRVSSSSTDDATSEGRGDEGSPTAIASATMTSSPSATVASESASLVDRAGGESVGNDHDNTSRRNQGDNTDQTLLDLETQATLLSFNRRGTTANLRHRWRNRISEVSKEHARFGSLFKQRYVVMQAMFDNLYQVGVEFCFLFCGKSPSFRQRKVLLSST